MDIKGLTDEGVSGDGNEHNKERKMECWTTWTRIGEGYEVLD